MRTNQNKYNYISKTASRTRKSHWVGTWHSEHRWTEAYVFRRSPTWANPRWRGLWSKGSTFNLKSELPCFHDNKGKGGIMDELLLPALLLLCWMLCPRPYLCIPWLTCTMRSDRAKESCDGSLLMSCCPSPTSFCILNSSKNNTKHHCSTYSIILSSGPGRCLKKQ